MYSNIHKCWKITHVIIGPPNAGKTCFFEYCTNAPLEEEKEQIKKKMITTQKSKFAQGYNRDRTQATIGMDLGVRHIKIDGQAVTLNIWDTAGNNIYTCLKTYFFVYVSSEIIITTKKVRISMKPSQINTFVKQI